MIQENEIRCGNTFLHNGEWNSEGYNGLFTWRPSDWYALSECRLNLEDVAPIPLTPEVLKACGFVYRSNWTMVVDKKVFSFNIGAFDNEWRVWWDCTLCSFVKMQHLHQLQNLFFALVGRELIYSPKTEEK